MAYTKNWIKILVLMYKKYERFGLSDWISFSKQKIFKSRYSFRANMKFFVELGWIEERKTKANGIVMKKEYCLTSNGFSAVHDVLTEIYLLEKKKGLIGGIE